MNSGSLILVHGYPFDHTLWNDVISRIDGEFSVLAPDLRGFGGQSTGSEEPSLDQMADDLKEQMERRGIARAVLAGMSMGGYVALAFAERYPERLAGLALVSSQAAADTEQVKASRRAMIDRVEKEGPAVAAEAVIPKLFAARNAGRAELLAYPRSGAERAGVEGITWALEAMARRPDRTKVLAALDIPVLVVHGAEDQFVPVAQARQLAQQAKQGQFREIASAGHATPLEAPAELAEALQALVARSFG